MAQRTSRPLPPIEHGGFTEAAAPQPLSMQPYAAHQAAGVSEPYLDAPAMNPRSSNLSDEYEDKAVEVSHPAHYQGDPEDTYYPAQMYSSPNERAFAHQHAPRGIWSYDDRRSFQKLSIVSKIFRILAFILVIGIILTLCIIMLIVIFLRPPNIGLNGIDLPQSIQDVQIQDEKFSVNATLNAIVANPNYISAHITSLNATAWDNNAKSTPIGYCDLNDQTIAARNQTNVNVPCQLSYNVQDDPSHQVLKDLVNRCGIVQGSKKSNLQILLDLHISIKILAFHIPISAKPTISMSCPITKDMVKQALGDHTDILKELGLGNLARSIAVRTVSPEALRNLAWRTIRSVQDRLAAPPALLHDAL